MFTLIDIENSYDFFPCVLFPIWLTKSRYCTFKMTTISSKSHGEPNQGSDKSSSASSSLNRINCVVSIIADDDSDADTLEECSPSCPDRPEPPKSIYIGPVVQSRAPTIRHIASTSSVCTLDNENRSTLSYGMSHQGHSGTQLNGTGTGRTTKTLGGRPYCGSTSGSNAGCVPILLSVPSAGPPRRRHSWICG